MPAPHKALLVAVAVFSAFTIIALASWLIWFDSETVPESEPARVARPQPSPPPASAPSTPTTPRVPALGGTIDYAALLANRSPVLSTWKYAPNQAVLIIQFPTLEAQGRALNRLAIFVEADEAPRTRILTENEIAAIIRDRNQTSATYYYGHDYRGQDIAAFYNMATTSRLPLRPEEGELREILLAHGLLDGGADGYRLGAGPRALVTIAASTRLDGGPGADAALPDIREVILRHELSHGEYFTNARYREVCHHFWQQRLTESERAAFTAYIRRQGYDADNPDLLVNEMQAYLAHTIDERVFSAGDIGVTNDTLAGMRAAFWQTAAELGIRKFPLNAP